MLVTFVVLLLIASAVAGTLALVYDNKNQDRQAYYACLKLSEKIVNEKNTNTGSTHSLSLPYCRL